MEARVTEQEAQPGRSPVIEPEVVSWEIAAILARKSPTERLAALQGMWRFGRALIETGVRDRHPDWTDDAVAREVARRVRCGSA